MCTHEHMHVLIHGSEDADLYPCTWRSEVDLTLHAVYLAGSFTDWLVWLVNLL